MSDIKIAGRYARSLFEKSKDSKSTDKVAMDIANLNEIVAESKDFRLFLSSPLISRIEKKKALNKLFESYQQNTRDLFSLMTEKGRENLIGLVGAEFTRIYNHSKGITDAEVSSAISLDQATVKSIEEFVKKNTGASEVKLTQKVDGSLVGGLTIMFDGRIYDSSVSGQINKMKKELNIA
jgi:F-type H+-transporting ATPase subunit delta